MLYQGLESFQTSIGQYQVPLTTTWAIIKVRRSNILSAEPRRLRHQSSGHRALTKKTKVCLTLIEIETPLRFKRDGFESKRTVQ